MINGLYSATSGMFNQIQRSDTIANNIANMETPGFKVMKSTFGQQLSEAIYRDSALEPMGPPLVSLQGGGSYTANVYNSFSQGPLRQTGSDYDIAISGKGFLVVETPSGRRYTRNGNFHPNEQREMVTAEGYRLVGVNGTITLPEGYFDVSEEGIINQGRDGEQALLLVEFDNPNVLRRIGHDFYALADDQMSLETPASETRIHQGYLEASNVQIVSEMVNLIDASRQYEANQKVIQALDDTLGRAVNEVGRVG